MNITNENVSTNNNLSLEQELIQLHNKAPYIFVLWSEDAKFIGCNDKTIDFFGVESQEKYRENLNHFIPEFQPDGSNSLELLSKYFDKCKETGSFYWDFMLENNDKKTLSVYVSLQKIKIKDASYIISYMFDLNSINFSKIEIDLRNKLIDATTQISKLLLSSFDLKENNNMDEIMLEVVKLLGKEARADRCYIWKNYKMPATELLSMKQIYEWIDDEYGIEAMQETELIENIPYDPDLYDLLSSRQAYNAIVKDLDEYSKSVLEPQNIKSILIVPIHIGDYFWGFIGFDNCHSEELWETFEEEMLFFTTLMIGTVIDRFDKNK